MSETDYKKLPGKGLRTRGLVSPTRTYCSLWLGADHLLQIDSQSGYTEEYKRFYFRDIQAITVRKTQNGILWTLILLAFFLFFAAFAFAVTDRVGSIILWSIAGVFGLFLAIHAARGATCDCHLKTAVQLEQLPSLKRLRNARKTLALIHPLIEQAQGSLAVEEISQHLDPGAPPLLVENTNVIPSPSHSARPPALLRPYQGIIHPLFFALLFFSGLIDVVHVFFHPVGFIASEALVGAAVIILAITALTKQHGTDLSKALRTVTWISGGYAAFLLLLGYIQMMALSINNPDLGGDQWSMIKKYAELEPMTTPWLLILLLINVVVASVLSLIGLILFRNWRLSKKRAPTPPVIPIQPTT